VNRKSSEKRSDKQGEAGGSLGKESRRLLRKRFESTENTEQTGR